MTQNYVQLVIIKQSKQATGVCIYKGREMQASFSLEAPIHMPPSYIVSEAKSAAIELSREVGLPFKEVPVELESHVGGGWSHSELENKLFERALRRVQ